MLKKVSPLLIALSASAAATLNSCIGQVVPRIPVPQQRDSAKVRQMLVAELKRQAPAFATDIDAAAERLHTERVPSLLIPGVEYQWAFFAPRRMSDIRLEALIGTWSDTAITLRQPSDWAHLAEIAGWRPQTSAEAISACAELVRLTRPMRNFVVPPILISDSSTLMRREVEGREQLTNRVAFPTASNVNNGFEVRGWFLEPGRTTLYSCVQRNADALVRELDTILGVGLPSLGP